MHIVGRIKLPKSVDVSSLYIQCGEGAAINSAAEEEQIVLRQGSTISSNSYFNSFYEKFYAKYTVLDSIYYLLKLEGDFQVAVYREDEGNNRELICQENYEQCQLSSPVKILLPINPTETAGRIYFEIKCLSTQGLFKEGLIATEQNKSREVTLGIITCTFKKEAYIKATLDTISQDSFLQSKALKIFVVDNGQTLNAAEFLDPRIQLIPNRNVGGSGGFTRGLIEGLQENTYSHFLFMDDDIELESESIYRLFTLYEYAKFDFAVAGTMLDLYKKQVLYEAGALYSRSTGDTSKFAPFSVAPLKNKLELQDTTSLNLLLLEEEPDYGGFWFFCVSKEMVEEIGLPLPYFIKIDDMEFGLRIKERFGNKIVAFPSIAVWHEPFYGKFPIWDIYYMDRNFLITHSIYGTLTYTGAIRHTTEALILALFFFDYNASEMFVKAFEDFLKGPDLLKNNQPEILHSSILKLSKTYKNQNVKKNYSPNHQVEEKSNAGTLKKIVSLLTLNGHLLPNFLTSDDDAFIWRAPGYPGQVSKAFAKKRALVFLEESAYLFQNEVDKLAGIRIMARWFKVAAESAIKWSSVSAAWRNASKELVTTKFWHQYLGLEE